MSVVLPAVECGWLFGLVLLGVLATDLAALPHVRHVPVLDAIWERSPTAGMICLAGACVLVLGGAAGLTVSAIYLAELRLLGSVLGANIALAHSVVFLAGTILVVVCGNYRGWFGRRYAVIVGTAFFVLFGIIFPALAA